MVKILDKNYPEGSSSLLKFVKLMYFTGFLPIKWTDNWINGEKHRFQISWPKTMLLIALDFLAAISVPAYIFLWHWLITEGFNVRQFFTLKYYLDISDGIITTFLCQLVYFAFPSYAFWIYGTVGKKSYTAINICQVVNLDLGQSSLFCLMNVDLKKIIDQLLHPMLQE